MIYFDNSASSHPKAPGVPQAVCDILERGCFNINRGGYAGAYALSALVFDVREKLAAFFDCPSGRNVAFSGGITQSINAALKGILRPGDNVLTTQMEHNAVLRPLAQLQAQGVNVEYIRCTNEGKLDIDDMRAKLNVPTRLVVMTHASNVCGTIMPIREAGALCRAHGALFMVDTAQTAGALPISMREDNIDILAFTGHKGLLGAQGIGGLALNEGIAQLITPLIAGGTGSHSDMADMPKELPDRLEAGTLNIPGIASLSVSLDYINSVGIHSIYAKEKALLSRLTRGLGGIRGVRIFGPECIEDKCAIAALDFTGMDNAAVSNRLDEEYGIMTRCGLHCAPSAHRALQTFPRGLVRCSVGHMNTSGEIDTLIEALSAITKGAGRHRA